MGTIVIVAKQKVMKLKVFVINHMQREENVMGTAKGGHSTKLLVLVERLYMEDVGEMKTCLGARQNVRRNVEKDMGRKEQKKIMDMNTKQQKDMGKMIDMDTKQQKDMGKMMDQAINANLKKGER